MLLFLNLDTRRFQKSIANSEPVTEFNFKRGDSEILTLQCVRSNAIAAITGTLTEMIYAAKTDYDEETTPLLLANDWTYGGTAGLYTATLTEDTVDLLAALATTSPISLKSELTFTSSTLGVVTSETVTAKVHNDVWKGGEGAPVDIPTPWVPGATAPVNNVQSSITTAVTGTNNDLVWTAASGYAGTDGDVLTIAYAVPTAVFTTTATATGTAITVALGTKARMVVTGTLNDGTDPVAFPAAGLLYAGPNGGNHTWTSDAVLEPAVSGEWYLTRIGTPVVLQKFVDGALTAEWESSDVVGSPDLVTTWTPSSPATGTPTVTAGTSSAAQVAAAVAADAASALLMAGTNAGGNDGTGAVATMTAVTLTGGVDVTAVPPYIRVAGGKMYIQQAGVWRELFTYPLDTVFLTMLLTALGIPTYADLAAANIALAVGKIYYDTALATLNVTTA